MKIIATKDVTVKLPHGKYTPRATFCKPHPFTIVNGETALSSHNKRSVAEAVLKQYERCSSITQRAARPTTLEYTS